MFEKILYSYNPFNPVQDNFGAKSLQHKRVHNNNQIVKSSNQENQKNHSSRQL